MKFESFRHKIAIVPQNGNLFNDTIFFNLQYGNINATKEEIEEICKKCHIHDWIMEMPEGYNSHVGDLGSKLSGGEKQRILIARALLKNADIILLDEATSSLDSHNEKRIISELDEVLKGKTVIYCAHWLSTIVNVDKIYVMGNGSVIESGTHSELVSNNKSSYSGMWKNFLWTNDTEFIEEIS